MANKILAVMRNGYDDSAQGDSFNRRAGSGHRAAYEIGAWRWRCGASRESLDAIQHIGWRKQGADYVHTFASPDFEPHEVLFEYPGVVIRPRQS